MHPHRIRKIASAFGLTLALAGTLRAQGTTPAPQPVDNAPTTSVTTTVAENPNQPSSETIVMNPFTVDTSTDVGYTAVNSLAGGRNNTPLAITPSTVLSLTQQFIDDLQLTDARNALKWTMNAVPQNFAPNVGSGNQFNSWANNLRGAGSGPQGGTPPTVNYFPIYATKDFFNVDRFEEDLGPNSILFGVGNIGGVTVSYTKIPRFDRDSGDADLTVNSFGGARAVFDVNQRASILRANDFAIRVDLMADRDQSWRKDDITKSLGASIATDWRLTPLTTLRFDLEVYQKVSPQFAQNLSDEYSQWDGSVNSPTWGATPVTSTGAPANANSYNSMAEWGGPSAFYLYIPEEHTIMNWGAGYRGAGLSDAPYYMNAVMRPYAYKLIGTDLTVPALPNPDFTVGPRDGTDNLSYLTLTAYWDQKINDNMEFELSAYRFSDIESSKNMESPSNAAVDINKQLPNGMANPEFGQLYSDFFLDQQIQDHTVNEFRGQFNFHFDKRPFNIPVKEWFSVSGGDVFHLLSTREYNGSYKDYPDPFDSNDWTSDMIWAREYWNDPHASINLPDSYDGNQIVYQPLPFNWFDHNLTEETKYAGVVSQTRLWDDRLAITLGARHDLYWSDLYSVRPPIGLPFPQGHTYEDDNGTTYSAGVVGYVTKWLALTYNYSSDFSPIGGGVSPSLTGGNFGPAEGKSNSFGVRFNTQDNKYYISADYYHDTSTGRITGDGIGIQGIWNDYYKAGGTATDIGPAGTLSGTYPNQSTQFNYADTEDLKDTGWEISGTANPSPNWRFQASYSRPKSVEDNDLPGSRAYFAAHLAEWSAVADGGSKLDGQLLSDLSNAQLTLNDTAKEATNAGVVKSTFNVVAAYTFTATPLNGLTIGLGATALGEQETSTGGLLYSPGYTIYNAFLTYSQHYNMFGKRVHVKYQLNIDNFTNNRDLVFTGFNEVGTQVQGSNYYLIDPLKVTLGLTLAY